MRRAIVHIGMPRTGSTSLQVVLTHLRPRLLEAGVLYPDLAPRSAGPGPHPNHQPFAETLDGRRPRGERAEVLERLSRDLAETRAEIVVLSYEGFSQQKPVFAVPETLRELFARHDFAMEVAVVVKPPSEQLNSLYAHRAQLVQEKRTFREYARASWRSRRFDYRALIEPWLAAAGGRITAVPMRDRRSDAALIERIVAGLGLKGRIGGLLGGEHLTRVENRSSGPVVVEASRRLRRMRAHAQISGHSRAIGHVLDDWARARGLDPVAFRGNAPDLFARVDDHYAAANDRFAHAVWGVPWSVVAAHAPPRPANELAGRPIPPETEAQVAALVGDACARFGLVTPPAWKSVPIELASDVALQLARVVGYATWRIR